MSTKEKDTTKPTPQSKPSSSGSVDDGKTGGRNPNCGDQGCTDKVWTDSSRRPELYALSPDGFVLTKTTSRVHRGTLHSDGYYQLGNYKVHRLILETYDRFPEEGEVCNHIDGVKTNNDITNLEWVTHSENVKHAIRTGLMAKPTPPKNDTSKVSFPDKAQIRRRAAHGEKHVSIAKDFPITPARVGQIVKEGGCQAPAFIFEGGWGCSCVNGCKWGKEDG